MTDKVNDLSTMFARLAELGNWRWPAQSAIPHPMEKRRTPAAGGIFLFLGPVVGVLYGIGRGQPILWMLCGFGAGVALALVIWLIDRRKR